MSNMFEEIDRLKKDLPKVKAIEKEVSKHKMNFYQIVAICAFVICFILGLLLGNLFPVCTATRGMYNNVCIQTEFNLSLTILVWGVSFIACLFFYAIGHIIALLTSIDEKLTKPKKKETKKD